MVAVTTADLSLSAITIFRQFRPPVSWQYYDNWLLCRSSVHLCTFLLPLVSGRAFAAVYHLRASYSLTTWPALSTAVNFLWGSSACEEVLESSVVANSRPRSFYTLTLGHDDSLRLNTLPVFGLTINNAQMVRETPIHSGNPVVFPVQRLWSCLVLLLCVYFPVSA